ncbi:MAG: hypothetical protein HRT77_06810 [Halioglobus sp.]|nr:hypothetical protein [Halioglobus sp.]
MARKRKLSAAVLSLGCLHTGALMALGLGEIEVDSFLNEPLQAEVDLLNLEGLNQEQIRIRLANSEDFARLGVDRAYFLTTIQFEVMMEGPGGPRVLISTDEPVLEPYLDFIVEARWPTGRLLREYTILVDPPVYADTVQVVSASERVYQEEGIAAPESAQRAATTEEGSLGLFPAAGATGVPAVESGADGSPVKTVGTRVETRASDLVPGAMPERHFNEGAATAPIAGARYMISRDDTLWRIASRAKPAGTSVHQTMLDIQRLNPDAFVNGNINRIKAGYIIYLPTADDISSTDLPAALAEVQEQNAAWREGRDGGLSADRGPTLRISASAADADSQAVDPAVVDAVAAETGVSTTATASDGLRSGNSQVDAMEASATDTAGRLASAERELETLKRIVSLKDDQIAALQNALAEAGVESDAEIDALYSDTEDDAGPELVEVERFEIIDEVPDGADPSTASDRDVAVGQETIGEEISAPEDPVAEPAVGPAPESIVATAPAPAEPQQRADGENGSWTRNLLYAFGAIVVAALAYALVRRRRDEDDAAEEFAETDALSDVAHSEPEIAVDAAAEAPSDDPAPAADGDRGYGERKHEGYLSDLDESDALAEADIYIAYGRHPQAIELLKNALNIEPNSAVYRLKLLEIYTELGDRGAATAELEQIHASADAGAIERADALMQQLPDQAPPSGNAPAAMVADDDAVLESDFSDLEIEDDVSSAAADDDLDLSGDFVGGDEGSDEEELVIADDGNGLSTKLDLARAYLDMGDDDGARQILDEIVAEGADDLKSEAQILLDRIGG